MIPTLVISVLALASFVVHPESGDKVHLFLFWECILCPYHTKLGIILKRYAKVTMGITTMVTMVVILTMVIPDIPATGERPLLSE